ncbi:hypothetical protein VNO77_06468 [Canavalia gladiata]|uniref:LOB domain-containing protein n=1 Tax=Canavalia gladiata TaxID=3824 RepID=A0AAN9QW43_CANGL
MINNNSSSSNISTITRNGNSTTQACAACKYQRRKCAPDCILAPYFPHDRQRQFLNAHKLFGVSNITKIIKYLDPHDKDQAMRTIIYQSDMRATDPVGGCYRYIQDLQAQIEYYRAELELVLQQLAIFRAQAQAQAQAHHHQQQHQQHHHHSIYAPTTLNADGEVMNNVAGNGDPLSLYNHPHQPPPLVSATTPHYQYLPQQDQYIMVHENDNSSQNSNTNLLHDHINTWAMQNSVSLSSLSLHGHSSNVSDDYDHKPVLDMQSDERSELGFESEELLHRSDEAVLFKIDDAVIKAESDCIQQPQDHDLKGSGRLKWSSLRALVDRLKATGHKLKTYLMYHGSQSKLRTIDIQCMCYLGSFSPISIVDLRTEEDCVVQRALSDLSILDLDVPYTLSLVAFAATEILVIIWAMISVTWQIVSVPATIASKYIQRGRERIMGQGSLDLGIWYPTAFGSDPIHCEPSFSFPLHIPFIIKILSLTCIHRFQFQVVCLNMAIKPTVALRAILVGGIAAFAKIAGVMKAAGGAKMGAAAAAMTAAATAAMAGSKQEQKDASQQPPK